MQAEAEQRRQQEQIRSQIGALRQQEAACRASKDSLAAERQKLHLEQSQVAHQLLGQDLQNAVFSSFVPFLNTTISRAAPCQTAISCRLMRDCRNLLVSVRAMDPRSKLD